MRQRPTASCRVPRDHAGLMLAEAIFVLFMVSVLVALCVSIFFQLHQESDSPDRSALEAAYLKYLARVPETGDRVSVAAPLRASDSTGPKTVQPAATPPAPQSGGPSASNAAAGTGGAPSEGIGVPPRAPATPALIAQRSQGASAVNAGGAELVIVGAAQGQDPSRRAAPAPGSSVSPGGLVNAEGSGSGHNEAARRLPATDTDIVAVVKPQRATASPVPLDASGQRAPAPGSTTAAPLLNTPEARSDDGPLPRASLKLHYRNRGPDVWTHWPDVNQRRITGTVGVQVLERAFEILAQSGAKAIADDLIRKGVVMMFGQESEFEPAGEHAAARLFYSTDDRPPSTPRQMPVITINPRYVDEDPTVLAAVLVREGTRFQQFLDGSALQPAYSMREAEFEAWMNGAAFWQEIRRTAPALGGPLASQEEIGYQAAQQGEGPLRDLIATLYPSLR